VIPENIDAIRAISGIEQDPRVSMQKTDTSLHVLKDFRR